MPERVGRRLRVSSVEGDQGPGAGGQIEAPELADVGRQVGEGLELGGGVVPLPDLVALDDSQRLAAGLQAAIPVLTDRPEHPP